MGAFQGRAAMAAMLITFGWSDDGGGGGGGGGGCDPTGVYEIMHTRSSGTCGDFPPGQLIVSRAGTEYLVQDGSAGPTFTGTVERSPRCRITVSRTIGGATASYTLALAGGRANGTLMLVDTDPLTACDGLYSVTPTAVPPPPGPSPPHPCEHHPFSSEPASLDRETAHFAEKPETWPVCRFRR